MSISVPLTPAERQRLRSQAHHLNAVILIGRQGLTPAVIQETDRALTAHQLIKIKWTEGSREDRDAVLIELCDQLDATPIQHIGKHLVLWRPTPETHTEATDIPSKSLKKPIKRISSAVRAKKTKKPARKSAKIKYWRN